MDRTSLSALITGYLRWRRSRRPIRQNGVEVKVKTWERLTSRTLSALHSFWHRAQDSQIQGCDTQHAYDEIEKIREAKAPKPVSVKPVRLGEYDPPAVPESAPDPEILVKVHTIRCAIDRVRKSIKTDHDEVGTRIFKLLLTPKQDGRRLTNQEIADEANSTSYKVKLIRDEARKRLGESLDDADVNALIPAPQRGRPRREGA